MLSQVLFKRLHPNARLPKQGYADGGSAGFDLWPVEQGWIAPGEKANVKLGFATYFPAGYVAQIDDRGSVGNAMVTHLAGVVDANFRGEWQLIMHNLGKSPYWFSPEKALAQVLFIRVEAPVFKEVEDLPASDRGAGQLGSSGH